MVINKADLSGHRLKPNRNILARGEPPAQRLKIAQQWSLSQCRKAGVENIGRRNNKKKSNWS